MIVIVDDQLQAGMVRGLSLACRSLGVSHVVDVRNLGNISSHDAIASVAWTAG